MAREATVHVVKRLPVLVVEALAELVTVGKQLEGEMAQSLGADLQQLLIVRLLACREVRFGKREEDESAEEGDVSRGHFLSGDNYSCIHGGGFLLLVSGHVHARATRAVPKPLDKLDLGGVDAVLVFVDVYQGVGGGSHGVVEGGNGGVLYVGRYVVDHEERHERVAQFALAGTLRTEEVEDGEGTCGEGDDVAEERGEIEAEADLAVVAEDEEELTGEVPEADHGKVEMHELPLEAEIVDVLLINPREGGKIEIALLAQVDDAVLIDLVELPTVKDTVAKGKEALLVPAQLLDLRSRLGLFVEETLQFDEFLLTGLPDEVAERFELLTELLQ